MKHTIFALASAQGRAGVSIIRLSGPQALWALQQLSSKTFTPRQATYTDLVYQGILIDQVVAIWFKAPHSFTGEDVAEFHLHGGRAVRESLFAALAELGLKPAGPGEFSRHAVEHGRLDLTRAEAIADLVEAETPAQLRQAIQLLQYSNIEVNTFVERELERNPLLERDEISEAPIGERAALDQVIQRADVPPVATAA